MAGLATDKAGNRIIQFTLGKRRTLRLGKAGLKTAEKIRGHIEDLVVARLMRQSVEPRTANWVGDLDDTWHKKLSDLGLVDPREKPIAAALGPFVDSYIAKRIDAAKSTRELWCIAACNLKDCFGADRDIATIHEGDGDDFALYLLNLELAPSTIHKRLAHARMFFKAARRHKLIAANPFEDVTGGQPEAAEKFYIPAEMADRILEACDSEWRLIFALARYGGLRCPNEVISLRWSDINWERDTIFVTSCKTARKGKPSRTTWMTPRLRQELLGAYEALDDGAPDEIFPERLAASRGPRGWHGVQLGYRMSAIIKRAGYTPWASLFNSCRSSHEIDLARLMPAHVVATWMGHSVAMSNRHYLRVTDDDYQRAANALRQVQAAGGTELQTPKYAR